MMLVLHRPGATAGTNIGKSSPRSNRSAVFTVGQPDLGDRATVSYSDWLISLPDLDSLPRVRDARRDKPPDALLGVDSSTPAGLLSLL